jgi:hypothetical protein
MKSFIISILFIFTFFAGNVLATGRLVAIADDWPLAGYFSNTGNDGAQLITSSIGWLTQNGGKKILFDGDYYNRAPYAPLSATVNSLQSHGYSVTVSSPSGWSATSLSQYDAVVWVNGVSGSGQKMLNYSNAGGNVLYVGGWASSVTQNNILLNAFKINNTGVIWNDDQTITNFISHPCVDGVTSIKTLNPNNLALLPGFVGTVVSAQGGANYIIAVPEPATLLLFGLGALLLRKKP